MAEIDAYVNHQRAGRLAKSGAKHIFGYDLDATEAVSLTMPIRTESYSTSKGYILFFK